MASIVTPGGLQITGAWTQAGFASCVHVRGSKHEDILFDCGVCEQETLTARHVFITHGHVDHIGAAITHARAKSLRSQPANYYVPTDILSYLQDALAAFELLDGSSINMNIIPVSPGTDICEDRFSRLLNMYQKLRYSDAASRCNNKSQ